MKPSPLILLGYHVEHLAFSVNQHFDLEAPTKLDAGDIKVTSQLEALGPLSDDSWEVRLQVVQNVAEGLNSPYNFAVVLVGLFKTAEGIPAEQARRLVETNGTSVLYGTTREIIRAATSQGPYQPLLLPTLSFYEPKNPEPDPPAEPSSRVAEDPPA